MLLSRVKTISKNHICFQHNNCIYYQSIDNDTKLDVFRENTMNIFFEQFEETIGKITYHDITHISVLENHDVDIRNLPNQLTQLFMMSSMCTNIRLTNCTHLISLIIIHSNLQSFPNISTCTKLKICQLTQSAITRFSPSFDLPSTSLEMFNLQGNLITNTDFTYDKLEKIKKPNFSDNYLKYDLFPEKIRLKSNLVRQGTYIHNPINHRNVQQVNIQNHVQNIGTTNTQLFSSQNVHLSSINKSVMQSMDVLTNLVKEHNIQIEKLHGYVSFHLLNLFKKSNVQLLQECCKKYGKDIETILDDHLQCPTIHSVTKKTYRETFEVIWSILCFQHTHQKIHLDDAFERIATELMDGHKLCFTGRYNRLINSMVGVIDGIQVGFSENEQLQLEFGIIIQKFNQGKDTDKDKDNKYTFENLYCDAKEILDWVKDIHVKQIWMDAILDLSPDPTKRVYEGNTYYQTWDDDILNIYDKTLEGYWVEDKILFLTEFY